MQRLLFICSGNICRSPTAEGVMHSLIAEAGLEDQIEVDSAGIGGWHAGERADPRSREAAARRGIEITSIARQVTAADLDEFDLVLAADRGHRRDLLRLAGSDPDRRQRIRMLREFEPASEPDDLDVPDPYYGGPDGFDNVLDMVQAACRGLLRELRASGGL
jgi:protein-tyrosine phosphatase